jgi:chromosome segregation ATPase
MEPIRPDEDELRASRPEQSKEPKAEKSRGKSKPASVPAGGGGSGGGSRALWLALLALAVAAGAGWWQQQQTLQVMEEQLEEADYWARQSKLALARFEGELSETGETLEQREQTLSDTLEEQAESLETAHSEIRKLWGIAYDRNRKRLDSNEEAIAGLQKRVGSLDKTVPDLEQRVSGVVEQLDSNAGRLDALSEESEQLVASVAALEEQLTGMNDQLAGIESSFERQLQRFGREQKLTLDGLDSRIGAIESQLGDVPSADRLQAMQAEMDELSQVVESIDSARAQLTSRLVRLSEQVDALRAEQ